MIPGCTDLVISMELCTAYAEDANVYANPVNINSSFLGEPTVSTGSFSNFGAGNLATIGTVGVNQTTGCITLEIKYPILASAPFQIPVFEIGAWNDGSNGCGNSTPIDFCPGNPPNCTPCTNTLCDQLCSDFLFSEFDVEVFPTGLQVLESNTNDNTISQIFQNQSNFGNSPGACLDVSRFYHIQEDLLVDTDWCYKTQLGAQAQANLQPRIVIDEGRRIIIPDNVSVTLEDVEIESCSEIFWDAIEVMPGGSLTMINCNIKDGHNAIRAHEGSTVNIRNCNFTDNYIGILFDGGFSPSGNSNPPISADIFNNSFTGTGNFVDPYPGQSPTPNDLPFAGMQLRNVSFVDLTAPDPIPEIPTLNVFDNMYNGIVSNSSSFTLKEARFSNLYHDQNTTPSGHGVFANNLFNRSNSFNFVNLLDSRLETSFTNMPNGITMRNVFGFVDKAYMTNVATGIEVEDCFLKKVTIKNCNISASEFGIKTINNSNLRSSTISNNVININSELLDPSDGIATSGGIVCSEDFSSRNGWSIVGNTISLQRADVGIEYLNGGGATIAENYIFKTPNKGNFSYSLARVVNSPNTQVNCNSLVDIGVEGGFSDSKGLEIIDSPSMDITCNDISFVEDAVFFDGPCNGTDFRANEMSNGFNGLLLTSEAVIGRQTDKGNCFDDNENAEAIHNSNVGQFVQESQFRVRCDADQSGPSCICPDIADIFSGTGNSMDFFQQVPFGNTLECESTSETCAEFKIRSLSSILDNDINQRLALGQSVYTHPQPNYDQMMQYNLYSTLLGENADLQGTTFQEFYNQTAQSDLQLITTALQAIDREEEFYTLTLALNSLSTDLSSLKQSLANGEIDQESYDQNKATILMNMQQNIETLNNSELIYNEQYQDNISNQLAAVHAMQGSETYTANMKWILTRKLETQQVDFIDFDEATWSVIYDMAIQCSADAGHAVYIARSLYNTKEWTNFLELQHCDIAQERSKAQQVELSKEADIYPNPSTGNFNITWLKDQVAKISVIDADGKLLHRQNVYQGNNQLLLPHLSAGLYFYTISDEVGDIKQGKLIILE